jgi:hypothetical protein
MPDCAREAAGKPLEIGKYAVAALIPELGKGVCKIRVVIHGLLPPAKRGLFWERSQALF